MKGKEVAVPEMGLLVPKRYHRDKKALGRSAHLPNLLPK